MEWMLVSLASLLAGFVDAIVGGGGLILLPALFATFAHAPPATLLGTNKSASVWGTAMATWQFSRRVRIPWRTMLPAAGAGFAGAAHGRGTEHARRRTEGNQEPRIPRRPDPVVGAGTGQPRP